MKVRHTAVAGSGLRAPASRGPQIAAALVGVLAMLTMSGSAQQAGYTYIDLFSLSSYGYSSPKPADVKAGKPFKSSIPAKIMNLDGKKVRIDGFMIPYDQAAMRVTEFMLVASYDSCGFGDMPSGMTDWVHVSMPKGRTAYYTANPIAVSGLFEVGEQFDKEGYVTSVYRLDADGVSGN
jgi:hypothetical protein